MLRYLALVVILVQRYRLVIALNQAAARRVVACGGECQAGVFAQRSHGLDQAFAEGGLAYDDSTIVILHGAGNDLGR
jgi:hypothetical protein